MFETASDSFCYRWHGVYLLNKRGFIQIIMRIFVRALLPSQAHCATVTLKQRDFERFIKVL